MTTSPPSFSYLITTNPGMGKTVCGATFLWIYSVPRARPRGQLLFCVPLVALAEQIA